MKTKKWGLRNDVAKILAKFVKFLTSGEFFKFVSLPSIVKLLVNFQTTKKFTSDTSSDSVFYADHGKNIKKMFQSWEKIFEIIIRVIYNFLQITN